MAGSSWRFPTTTSFRRCNVRLAWVGKQRQELAHSNRWSIAQKRVDYVVCTRRCDIVAVVELDDKTHSRAKDELRNARLEQAGIRTVRFQARNKPKVDAIHAMILGTTATEAGKAATEPTSQGAVHTGATPSTQQ